MTHPNPMDAAFLADIREHPEDDVPRLIYADWLDDHGEEKRAEFIRVQCEFSKLVCNHPQAIGPQAGAEWAGGRSFCNNTKCRHCELYRQAHNMEFGDAMDFKRSRQLLGLPFDRVYDADTEQGDVAFWQSWRGFVHTVRCPTNLWLQHREKLVRWHPLERVELTDKRPLGPFEGRLLPIQWCVFLSVEYGSGPDELNEDLVGKRSALHIHFKDDEAAFDWLSSRLIARAMELAGLGGKENLHDKVQNS